MAGGGCVFPPFFSLLITTMMRAKIAAKEDQILHIRGSKFANLPPRLSQ